MIVDKDHSTLWTFITFVYLQVKNIFMTNYTKFK